MTRSVVIVGGGVMGSATACFLARDHGVCATVIEADPSYARASSARSASSIRQQFGCAVNVELSRASLAFMRRAGVELACGDERPDLALHEPGYLTLAAPAGAAALSELHACQRALGVDVALLTPHTLSARFPWLATDDLGAGNLGLSGEGWFDAHSLLHAFKRKAIACGARFVTARASGLEVVGGVVQAVLDDAGTRHACDSAVLAAGAWSAQLLSPLGLDLPVRARKRDVFVFDAAPVAADMPLVVDPSGLWFRPEGQGPRGQQRFIAGGPPRGDDLDDVPLDAIDHGLFDDVLWPALARRVPSLEALRVHSGWSGYYEMNTFDHNGLVGAHDDLRNLYLACGFSGHGMQQAPAVGQSLATRIALGRWGEVNLDALSPARIALGQPLYEPCVI